MCPFFGTDSQLLYVLFCSVGTGGAQCRDDDDDDERGDGEIGCALQVNVVDSIFFLPLHQQADKKDSPQQHNVRERLID